jgi:hypothetical protein
MTVFKTQLLTYYMHARAQKRNQLRYITFDESVVVLNNFLHNKKAKFYWKVCRRGLSYSGVNEQYGTCHSESTWLLCASY